MGLYSNAHLIFGVFLPSFGEEDPDTYEREEFPWHDEEEGYVDLAYYLAKRAGSPGDYKLGLELEKDAPVSIDSYGHYEDPDDHNFLVIKGLPKFDGDCWSETIVDPEDLKLTVERWDLIAKADAWCLENGLPSVKDAKWILVASFG